MAEIASSWWLWLTIFVVGLAAGCQPVKIDPVTIAPKIEATVDAKVEAALVQARAELNAAIETTRTEIQKSGPQSVSGNGRTIQIGTLKVDGLALAVVCCCAIAAGWLWKGGRLALRGKRALARRRDHRKTAGTGRPTGARP